MNYVFFDTSALVKQYTAERGSNVVNTIFRSITPKDIVCSILGVAELISILVRKKNDGRIPAELFEVALLNFESDIVNNDQVQKISVHDELVEVSIALVIAHNINSTDAIILRSALDVQQFLQERGDTLLFCAADKRLLRAAQSEGLTVFNPEEDILERLQQLLAATPTAEEPQ